MIIIVVVGSSRRPRGPAVTACGLLRTWQTERDAADGDGVRVGRYGGLRISMCWVSMVGVCGSFRLIGGDGFVVGESIVVGFNSKC